MAIKLNGKGVKKAKSLISDKKIDTSTSWVFSAEDGNTILGSEKDWNEYAKWFLAIDDSKAPETKEYYKYPFGKNDKVYRSALIAIKQRAGQQKAQNILNAAGELIDSIPKSKIKEAKDLNLIVNLVKQAIQKKFSISDSWVRVESVTEDKVVYAVDSILWEISYTIDDQQHVSFIGESKQVQQTFTEIPMDSSSIVEAIDKTGKKWKVIIVESGISHNGFFYSNEVLSRDYHKFEGARALLRSDEDHLTGKNTSSENLVGVYKNVEFAEGKIYADFYITESQKANDFKDNLKSAWDLGVKDFMGLSIVVEGVVTPKRVGDKFIKEVNSINKVNSVDIVLDPSAGGRFVAIAEAKNETKKGDSMNREAMLALLKKLGQQVPDDITDEKLNVMIIEATQKVEAEENKIEDHSGETEEKQEITITEADMHDFKVTKCALTLSEKLKASKLPASIMAIVESKYKGKIFTDEELEKEIESTRKIASMFAESTGTTGLSNIKGDSASKQDTLMKAIDGFWANEDIDKVPRFRSFRKLYITITGDEDVTGLICEAKNLHIWKNYQPAVRSFQTWSESIATSDLTQILGDSITRAMLKEYRMPELGIWRNVVSEIGILNDYRTQRRMRFGGYGNLPTVAQGGTYQSVTSPPDEEATYAATKRGGLEDITEEAIKNDDVGALRAIPRKLARAAGNTLRDFVFAFFTDNSATTYDSITWFHATSHGGNLITGAALSATTLMAAKLVMMKQAAYNQATDVMGLVPKFLLIPPDLEDTAFRLTSSPSLIGATNNSGTEPNIHSTYGLTPIIVPNWTDTNDWYLIANPKDVPTIEIGFMNGREEPELFVQDNPSNGSMFTADKITYKIKHVYGGATLDHRGVVRNEG